MVGGDFCRSGMPVLKFTHCCMQGLDFELIVYTPYRSVDGFIYDLEVRSQVLSNSHFLFSYPWRFRVYHSEA
jgi:hypothetical protein